MPSTNFVPSDHAFRFPNQFVNTVLDKWWFPKIETTGRCGGMCYAALDYYFAGISVPDFTPSDFDDGSVPPDGHRLADYLYTRQLDSMKWRDGLRFGRWTARGDTRVMSRTLHNEIPKAKESIDDGEPVVLGLLGSSSLKRLGKGNHQAVCYAYSEDASGITTLYIYDPNHPPTHNFSGEVELSRKMGGGLGFEADHGGPWRGFFVQRYSRRQPPQRFGGGGGVGGGGGGTFEPGSGQIQRR